MFNAFLSYSHRTDAKLAALLQRALERLGTPWWRRSPVRVFRYDATLPASAALWSSIERGLRQSENFVLLASPAAAASPWVEREVRWWLDHRPRERLLIAVTAGEIEYPPAARDFNWTHTTCLPESLRGVFTSEPLWVDLRFAASLPTLSLRHSRLRGAALSLVAAVRGIDKDQLESVDLREHRRSMMAAFAAVAAITVLAAGTIVALRSANTQGQLAQANRLQAESRRLAAEAVSDLTRGGPGLESATLRAALAWRLAPTEEARAALERIDNGTSQVARVLGRHSGGTYKVALSPDGQVLATAGWEGAVLRWNVTSGEPAGPALGGQGWPDLLRYSRDGTHLLMKTRHQVEGVEEPAVWLFRMADHASLPLGEAWLVALRQELADLGVARLCVAVSPRGERVAMAAGTHIVVVSVADGALEQYRVPAGQAVVALGFDDTALVFVADQYRYDGDGSRAGRIDVSGQGRGRVQLGPRRPGVVGSCDFTSMSGDARRVVSFSSAWRIDERLALQPIALPDGTPTPSELTGHHAPELDDSGQRMTMGIAGTGYVLSLDERRFLFKTPRQRNLHGPPLTLSADGRYLAGLQDGVPVVWELDINKVARRIDLGDCASGLADHCVARLCERLTTQPDDERWRELLGPDYRSLLDAAKGLSCAGGDRR